MTMENSMAESGRSGRWQRSTGQHPTKEWERAFFSHLNRAIKCEDGAERAAIKMHLAAQSD